MVAVSGYRFVRYNGTDWCDALVPIRPLQWYRFADIITFYHNVLYTQTFPLLSVIDLHLAH